MHSTYTDPVSPFHHYPSPLPPKSRLFDSSLVFPVYFSLYILCICNDFQTIYSIYHSKRSCLLLSLSFQKKKKIVSTTSSLSHAANADTFTSIPSKSSSDASIPYVLENLISRDKDLRAQLRYWTNWGRHKVMQTTNRLNKDKAELQTLRQEKLEAKKEKEAIKDSIMKKIGEMDTALPWSRTQVEVASVAVRKLEFDKIRLEQELEAAKLRVSESAASSQEASLKEIVTLKKAQTCESERTLLQEELVTEKRVLSQL